VTVTDRELAEIIDDARKSLERRVFRFRSASESARAIERAYKGHGNRSSTRIATRARQAAIALDALLAELEQA
jgi:3-phenylpropionate/cinnamic acid dioxygenase small subunit